MSKVKITAIIGEDTRDYIDVDGDMSPAQITELYLNIITHMVKFKDEDKFCTDMCKLISSSMV